MAVLLVVLLMAASVLAGALVVRRGRPHRDSRLLDPQGYLTPETLAAMERNLTGRLLGRYVLEGVLSTGGFGAIYRAIDLHRETRVCLKMPRLDRIQQEVQGGSSFGTFIMEAKLRAKLQGDHHIQIYDRGFLLVLLPGFQVKVPFYSMELFPGRNLGEIIREQGKLPLEWVHQIFLGVLQALKEAHLEGVIHHDLKPANILVELAPARRASDRGRPDRVLRVKLIDFGLAGKPGSGGTEPVRGTLGYIAPELFNGATPGPETDVFSLGVIFLEAMTGGRCQEAGDGRDGSSDWVSWVRGGRELAVPAAVPAPERDLVKRMVARDPRCRPTTNELLLRIRDRLHRSPGQ